MKFKHKHDESRFLSLAEPLQWLAHEMSFYCQFMNKELVITATRSTMEEDRALGRVSTTHLEGRAFDISVKGWEKEDIKEFMNRFDQIFNSWGALVKSPTGQKRVLLYDHGKGDNYHIHVQVRKDWQKIEIPGEVKDGNNKTVH